MTTEEKILNIQTVLNDEEATDELITVYLNYAKAEILNTRYPFGVPSDIFDVPPQYEKHQCELATRYFLRRGDEGEQIHNEDGVHRHYGSVDDVDILEKIVPIVKVI